jgi:hypothetical protein
MVLKQGDLALSGNLSTSALANISVAYAFIDNFSALVESTYDPQYYDDNDYYYSSYNAALGYNTKVGKQWRADFYAGGGLGTGRGRGDNDFFVFSSSNDLTRARFSNIFGQADFGLVDEEIEVAYQLRGNYVMFNRFEHISENLNPDGTIQSVDIEYGHKDMFFVEHSFLMRLGTEQMKILGFVNITTDWNGARYQTSVHSPVNLGVGVQFRLNALQ